MNQAGALAIDPDAITTEPLPEPPTAVIPDGVAARFDAGERAGLYGVEARAALSAMLALDEDATRASGSHGPAHQPLAARCVRLRRRCLSEGYRA